MSTVAGIMETENIVGKPTLVGRVSNMLKGATPFYICSKRQLIKVWRFKIGRNRKISFKKMEMKPFLNFL